MSKSPKYIFVVGGVLSGVGKGITAASIGNILKSRGLRVNIQKCDPYLNVDAGTLNPGRHGETFVTHDGAETDLDLGHYERFVDIELNSSSSLMSGRILQKVIADERAGKYLGRDVQLIPHVTQAMKENIIATGSGFDVHIVEIGGTIGDIEALPFIETIRELGSDVGWQNRLYVHVVYLPFLGASQETKTKPAQNAVKDLRSYGIMPDIIAARSEGPVNEETLQKLSSFTVERQAITSLPNAETVYQVPLTLEDSGIGDLITKKLGLKTKKPDMKKWQKVVDSATAKDLKPIKIGVITKYMDNVDTYMSIFEALRAAAWDQSCKADIVWVDAEKITDDNVQQELSELDAVVVPGGFGARGVEGMISAAKYCLKSGLPYLGICLGMQVGVIASARTSGLEDVNSTEFDPECKNPVINTMDDQKGKEATGGSMRLGDYPCSLQSGSLASKLYSAKSITERHRHRYEANNEYRGQYTGWGIKASGTSPAGDLVEIIEIDKPTTKKSITSGKSPEKSQYFIASQFHPEFKSRPNRPHPLFLGLIKAAK